MAISLQVKKAHALISLLKDDMGMERQAAATLVSQWLRSDSQEAFASTFLVSAIHHQIYIYRKQSFAKFGISVAIHPANNLKPLKVRLPEFGQIKVGYDMYVFSTIHNDQPEKTLLVRLFNGKIQVHFCNTWQPISAYLDEVDTEPTFALDPAAALNAQFHWWNTTGKSFNFKALPGELRNNIYDWTFGPVAYPFPRDKSRKHSPVYTPDLAITRVSRDIRKEATYRLYSTTVFILNNDRLTQRLLRDTHLRNNVRHVTLALSHSEYFSLFGLQPNHFDLSVCHSRIVTHLRKMNLTTLQIHFQPPSKIAEKPWLEGACQKQVIDHTIKAAWSSIKGHPFELTGSINPCHKQEIEDRFRKARKEFEAWKALKLAATGQTATLREYDEFLEKLAKEPAGGVMLEGGACVDEQAEEMEQDIMSFEDFRDSLRCRCKRNCMKWWKVKA